MNSHFVFTPSPLRHRLQADGERSYAPVQHLRPQPSYGWRRQPKVSAPTSPVTVATYDANEWEDLTSVVEAKPSKLHQFEMRFDPPRSPSSAPRRRERQAPTQEAMFDTQRWFDEQRAGVAKALVTTMHAQLDGWREKSEAVWPSFESLDVIVRELLEPRGHDYTDVRADPERWSRLQSEVERHGGVMVPHADPTQLPMLLIDDCQRFTRGISEDIANTRVLLKAVF